METMKTPPPNVTMRVGSGPGLPLFLIALAVTLLVLSSRISAQTIKLENLTASSFKGWTRVNVDTPPPHPAGLINGARYVVGLPTGRDTVSVDIWTELEPFEKVSFDLAKSKETKFTLKQLPGDILAHFGGPLRIGNVPMAFRDIRIDGAAIASHLTARFGRMMHADVWLLWYPDQPAWSTGEVLLTCSNPTVHDMTQEVEDLKLAFGDALTLVPGGRPSEPLIGDRISFADGQARAYPITFVWLRHLTDAGQWATVGAVSNLGISAVGIENLWPGGRRPYPEGSSAARWARERYAEAVRRLHTWDEGVCGPARSSGVTGAQEDQAFQRGEALLPDGPAGADVVTYLSALKYANRPCHHLEFSGAPVTREKHPNLAYWDARIHWHTTVSPDRLGKPRPATIEEAHGWSGPDVEHWLIGTLMAGQRYRPSPALTRLLEHQAHIYTLQATTAPGRSTSVPYSSRAVAWEGLASVLLWRALPPPTSKLVRKHAEERIRKIILPTYGTLRVPIWDRRLNDGRLGEGLWWQPWQQSIGCYGLDLAGEIFDIPEARKAAHRAAVACVTRTWIPLPGASRFRGVDKLPFTETPLPLSHFTSADYEWGVDWYELTWDVPAVWTVLRHDPNHRRAREIWKQVWEESKGGGSWFPPGSQLR